jgi:predicted dehydrogenase
MRRAAPIGVGVIGLGFMGGTHLAAYRAAAAAGHPCRIVAVSDRNRTRLRAHSGSRVRGYADARRLLDDPAVDLVSICTPTDTHVELALAALDAKKHVLLEKPVAIRPADVRRVARAASRASTLCMPAMCMRFWPGWRWLRERIVDGSFGAVRSAVFQRLSSPPRWASFYRDVERTGGALVDLHIHDADFIRWCFGDPTSISSTGSLDHVTTLYRYSRGPDHVVAEGGWDHSPGFAFRMRYVLVFDEATADFDLLRKDPLLLARRSKTERLELEPLTGYDGEVRHLLRQLTAGERALDATLDDAVAVAWLLQAERSSLPTGRRLASDCSGRLAPRSLHEDHNDIP